MSSYSIPCLINHFLNVQKKEKKFFFFSVSSAWLFSNSSWNVLDTGFESWLTPCQLSESARLFSGHLSKVASFWTIVMCRLPTPWHWTRLVILNYLWLVNYWLKSLQGSCQMKKAKKALAGLPWIITYFSCYWIYLQCSYGHFWDPVFLLYILPWCHIAHIQIFINWRGYFSPAFFVVFIMGIFPFSIVMQSQNRREECVSFHCLQFHVASFSPHCQPALSP